MESLELNKFWGQVKAALIEALPDNAHPWIYPLEISAYENGVLTAVTGQLMGRDYLRKNCYRQIVDVIKKISKNENSDFVLIYDENAAKLIKKGDTQIRTGDKSFAGSCLTTWPCRLNPLLYPILDILNCQ